LLAGLQTSEPNFTPAQLNVRLRQVTTRACRSGKDCETQADCELAMSEQVQRQFAKFVRTLPTEDINLASRIRHGTIDAQSGRCVVPTLRMAKYPIQIW
jgi:hypothetical protein